MANNPEPVELGFAEFVSKLISEMFDAITSAQFDQETRLAELMEASSYPVEKFGERFITDEQVYAELVRLFPGNSDKLPTLIYIGAEYQPATKSDQESPPIETLTGVRLEKSDYGKKRGVTLLKKSAITKINSTIRNQLAASQLTSISQIINRGVPRVIADAGKINAKLTYEIVSTENTTQAAEKQSAPIAARGIKGFTRLQKTNTLSNFKLLVRQADERAPQTPNMKVNVFGEVEITFKTIT